MGCPDWPMCFGQFAPPFSEEQLPSNYQEVFLEKRIKKLDRFVGALEKVGLNERAAKIRADKSLLEPEAFDVTKAWIEYINRLFGVLSGLFGVAFLILGFRIRKKYGNAFLWLIVGFIFLLLNGWLGSYVVATNLLPGIVSLHFMLSFICLFAFMKALDSVVPTLNLHQQNSGLNWNLLSVVLFILVILGTWSREQVEVLKDAGRLLTADGEMLNFVDMDWLFAVHRYVPALIAVWGYLLWKRSNLPMRNSHGFWLFIASIVQISFGAIHIVFVIPTWTQIAHVVLGSGLLTYVFAVSLSYRESKI
jgi:cytochrome c oxidase assembly protein subunit 15